MTTEMITNNHNRHILDRMSTTMASIDNSTSSTLSTNIIRLPSSSDNNEIDNSNYQTTILTSTNNSNSLDRASSDSVNDHYQFFDHHHHRRRRHRPYHRQQSQGPSKQPPSSPTLKTTNDANSNNINSSNISSDGSSPSSTSSPISSATSSPSCSTPTTPLIDLQNPTINNNQHHPLSSLNVSALVRTISNGSTFGPIPDWPNCYNTNNNNNPNNNAVSTTIATSLNKIIMTTNPNHSNQNNHQTSNNSDVIMVNSDPNSSDNSSRHRHQQILNPQSTITSPDIVDDVNNSTNYSSSSSITSSQTNTPISSTKNLNPSTQQSPLILATTSPVYNNYEIQVKLPLIFGENYVLTSQIEASNLYQCLEMNTDQEFRCKILLSKTYYEFLAPHLRMEGHEGINQVQKIIIGQVHTFVLFKPSYGDLHSYVRTVRRLNELEAIPLFKQIVKIVADCHSNGIILRDLKLRKFIFSNKERTQLKLETLEGASLFDEDDTLYDKHGCPAYVSPEILTSNSFSGLAADCWGMGVILYTMLVGRYPFHDVNASLVFCKIRRGNYHIPDKLSREARCLIRSLMRINPEERLSAEDVLAHRWLQLTKNSLSLSLKPRRPYNHDGILVLRRPPQPEPLLPQPAVSSSTSGGVWLYQRPVISNHQYHSYHQMTPTTLPQQSPPPPTSSSASVSSPSSFSMNQFFCYNNHNQHSDDQVVPDLN